MIGEIASKKKRLLTPVISASLFARALLVSGPEAIMTVPAGISWISLLITVISGLASISLVILFANISLSTTRAFPPGIAA